MDARAAWRAKYARQPAPWRGDADLTPFEPWLPAPGARVLELGAGGGKTHATLVARGFRSLPVDWAPEALPAGGVLADVRRLPVQGRSVAAVVCVHVLDHQDEAGRSALVREAARVLRPGGVLLLQAFAQGDLRSGTGRPVAPGTREREGIPTHYFRPDEVQALLAGFRVEHLEEVARPTRFAGPRRILRAAARVETG